MDEHPEARGIEPACHGEILPRRPPACPSLYGGGQPRPAIFRGVRSLIFLQTFLRPAVTVYLESRSRCRRFFRQCSAKRQRKLLVGKYYKKIFAF